MHGSDDHEEICISIKMIIMKRVFAFAVMIAAFINNASAQVWASKDDLPYYIHSFTGLVVKTIEVSGNVNLQYVEQGQADGTPVIFLHGITDSWHSFERVLPLLPKSIHAFAISQRGHGNSDRPANGYHPRDFANDLADFIKKKDLGKAVIVGHSMGGIVAQQFALMYPELLKGMVIVSSDAAFRDNKGLPEFHEEIIKMKGPAIDPAFMDAFQKGTIARPIDTAYYQLLVAEGLKVPARVFKSAFYELMEVDFTPELWKVKAPVMIMWGDQDGFCLRGDQDNLKNNIINSRLVIYCGTGHALHWEEPILFAEDVIRFVRGL
jgi:non-heme chloroperoxidase